MTQTYNIIAAVAVVIGTVCVFVAWFLPRTLGMSETVMVGYMIFGVLMILLGVFIKHLEVQTQIRGVLVLSAESK